MITVSNVANASQGELLCMTYEIFLHHTREATQTREKAKEEHISQAIEVIKQLVGDLNFEIPIARDLFKVYIYVQNLLINHQYQMQGLEEAYQLVHTIYDGYKEITQKEVNKKPAMQNVESVYAGMTYGKGQLNEIVMTDINRGYNA